MTAELRPLPVMGFPQIDGTPAVGWKLHTYENGTTTNKETWQDQAKAASHANPIIFDARGEKEIWWEGTYTVKLVDENDVEIWSVDDYAPTGQTASLIQTINELLNGSLEADGDSDGIPDNWVRSALYGAAADNQRNTSDPIHGAGGLKCTSTGSGGSDWLSGKFYECTPNKPKQWYFNQVSSVVDIRNIINFKWYTETEAASSTPTSTVYDEAAANPTTKTPFTGYVVPPSDARFYKLQIKGCDPSDITPGNVIFDNFVVHDVIKPFFQVGDDIASAATLVLPGVGDFFEVTGAVAATAISSRGKGTIVKFRTATAMVFTHHATNMILKNAGANITSAAGDIFEFFEYDDPSGGVARWEMLDHKRADGLATASQIPTGSIFPYAGVTEPTGYLFCDGDEKSATTYEGLFDVLLSDQDANGWGLPTAINTFTATAATDQISATTHGLVDNDVCHLSNSGGALPAGLSALTKYYAIYVDDNTIQVETTIGGGAVDITDTGSGTHSIHGDFQMPDMRGRIPTGADNMGGSSANRNTSTEGDNIGQASGAEDHTLTESELAAHTHPNWVADAGTPRATGPAEALSDTPGAGESTGGDAAHNNMQPYQTCNYIIRT